MGRRYPTHGDDWVRPVPRGYRMACCDCGLVHRVDFRVVAGQVEFRIARDSRATGQLRRWRHA